MMKRHAFSIHDLPILWGFLGVKTAANAEADSKNSVAVVRFPVLGSVVARPGQREFVPQFTRAAVWRLSGSYSMIEPHGGDTAAQKRRSYV
jgi:hypothetical protein